MKGLLYTEEIHSWYNEALREIRRELADEAQSGNYSDGLINALACMQATSVSPITLCILLTEYSEDTMM